MFQPVMLVNVRGVPHQLIASRRLDFAMRAAGPRRQQPRRGLDEPHTEDTCFSAFLLQHPGRWLKILHHLRFMKLSLSTAARFQPSTVGVLFVSNMIGDCYVTLGYSLFGDISLSSWNPQRRGFQNLSHKKMPFLKLKNFAPEIHLNVGSDSSFLLVTGISTPPRNSTWNPKSWWLV